MSLRRITVLAALAMAVAPAALAGAEQPAERVDPPGRSFTVAAVGDWLSEALVNNAAAAAAPPGVRYDHEPLLRPITPILDHVDLAICHMEVPIGLPGAPAGKVGTSVYGTSLIAAPYELAGDLRRVGFDRCSTASNHSNDLGIGGIASTLDAFDAAGITHTGTARTPTEAAPRVIDVSGVDVAHLSYARNSNTGFPRDAWRISQAITATNVVDDVRAARAAGAEVVIVSLHVFVEMSSTPYSADRALVNTITAFSDVDLIIVHGPHVVQPVERVNGALVYWSVGNFISGMGVAGRGKYSDLRTLDGLMATVRFTEQDNGSWTTEPFTVLLCNETGSRKVWPAVTTLADPTISSTLRTKLNACLWRSAQVVADLH
jgi:poly-gamma-glutamate synthesis protein (capsule biosynthesis protein)